MITYLLAFLLSLNSITLKVNGLTCSMCSLSVKKNIEKVYFVDNVDANIEEVTYDIQFKKNYYVDYHN